MRPAAAALVAATVVLGACSSSTDGATGPPSTAAATSPSPAPTTTVPAVPSTTPTTAADGDPRRARVTLTPVATLDAPDAMAIRPSDPALYVAERPGRVRRITPAGTVDPTPVVDLAAETATGGERGLLGLAFSPDGGRLYINHTGLDGTIHLVEFSFRDGRATDRRPVLSIDHRRFANHNGGDIVFGPDGMLYMGVGDGGSSGDPSDHGQALDTLLGKVLRIDPRPSGGDPYTIPRANPLATRPGARPEIWAYGLRNPWRISFDRGTGDLWIGDVGQNRYEEIDREPAGSGGGRNYGWSLREGTHEYKGDRPPGSVDPVHEYGHGGGECAVTGGYVYRGSAIPDLVGSYLFTDFCAGRLQALAPGDRARPQAVDLGIDTDQVASFGQDQNGELYALSLSGEVARLTPAPSPPGG